MSDAPQYQKRPRYFANYFVRVMAKSCLANEVGPEACWLLSVVAMTEDAKGYREPVTFFNEQLLPLVGLGSVKALARARDRAVASGWLVYIPGGKGKAGRYWVNIPAAHSNWDNAASDESADEIAVCADYPVSISTNKPPDNRQETAREVANKPPDNRQTSGQHSYLKKDNLFLTDKTVATTDPGRPGADQESVPFDPLRAEQEARKLFEQRWHDAGLRKFSRINHTLQATLTERLRDAWWAENYPAALAKAGRIPFLATGVGRTKGALDVSEFLRFEDECRKIIDGFYDPRPVSPPTAPPAEKPQTLGDFKAKYANYKPGDGQEGKAA